MSIGDEQRITDYLHSNCERRIQILETALQRIGASTLSPRIRTIVEKALNEERSLCDR